MKAKKLDNPVRRAFQTENIVGRPNRGRCRING